MWMIHCMIGLNRLNTALKKRWRGLRLELEDSKKELLNPSLRDAHLDFRPGDEISFVKVFDG